MKSKLLVFGLIAAGCGKPTPWLTDIERPLPPRLSQVGIFANLEALEPTPTLLTYEPGWPLYSNGADKHRFLALPDCKTIDAASWTFPVGAVLAKTFTFDDSGPIETRLLFRRARGWDYALYEWNDARTEASLHEDDWTETTLGVRRADGSSFAYALPSRLDCRTCHETSQQHTGTPVLGIGPHQLGPQLAESIAFLQPPVVAAVSGRSDAETAALGYFVGNCISCHTGGSGPNASFSLYPEHAVAETVGRPVQSETGEGIRVVPGDPDASALFLAVTQARSAGRRATVATMPPIGLTSTDPEAEPILRRWIDELLEEK